MKTYKLYLIRHGLTTANLEGRYVGRTDVDLCEAGVAEILSLKEKYEYPNISRIYSSPLKRALQTSRLIYRDITPITVKNISEYNFGEFENKSFDELKENEKFIKFIESNKEICPLGGETMSEFQARIVEGINDILMDMMKDKITEAAVFTHGGVIMTLLALCGLPKQPPSSWATNNATGYTALINASLWGNARAFEVFTPLPIGMDKENIVSDYQKIYETALNAEDIVNKEKN